MPLIETDMAIPTALDEVAITDEAYEANLPTATAAQMLARDGQEHRDSWTAAQLLAATEQEELIHLRMHNDMYGTPIVLQVPLNQHITLGLIVAHDPSTTKVFVKSCQEGTHISRTPRWRSTIRKAVIRSVNDTRVRSRQDLIRLIQEALQRRDQKVMITFAKIAVRDSTTEEEDAPEIPQLRFDQLRHLNQMHIAMHEPEDTSKDAFLN
jgi:hypothetical protein